MSLRNSALGLGLVLVVGGAVAWWGFSRSQDSTAAPAQDPSAVTAPNTVAPAPSPDPASSPDAQAQFNQNRALLENERNTIDVVQRTGDGVIYVAVRSAPQATSNNRDFFSQFLQDQPREGEGSGFVIEANGLALTNYHVVEDVAQGGGEITVRFHNDPKSYPARIVGTAEPLDMALIRIEAPSAKFKPMPLGNSDQVRVGQKTIAMGNPFGLEFTVTEGIVSAVRRNPSDTGGFVPSVIQTDAAINPGNSGGPLLNSSGQVIGINSFIYSTSGGFGGQAQSAGIGFAIPINLAKQYLPDLKAGRRLTQEELIRSRPRLGISLSPGSMAEYPAEVRRQNRLPENGIMVAEVEAGGPAQRAGLRAATRSTPIQTPQGTVQLPINGDIIQAADGNPINSLADLRAILASKPPGQTIALKVWRGGQTVTVNVVPQIIR
ncbi:MAG: trypsin-like peptidase domain-containing protein [Meiothermus sp.]|nr:trypsin-like peptidase domain-containing protein [Meiothermus sp.]